MSETNFTWSSVVFSLGMYIHWPVVYNNEQTGISSSLPSKTSSNLAWILFSRLHSSFRTSSQDVSFLCMIRMNLVMLSALWFIDQHEIPASSSLHTQYRRILHQAVPHTHDCLHFSSCTAAPCRLLIIFSFVFSTVNGDTTLALIYETIFSLLWNLYSQFFYW